MKNIRLLLLLFCLCFLTGCTAEYNLEITSSQFKESTTISMNQSEFQKFTSDSNNQYFNMYYDDENDQASEGTQKPLPNVKYYDYDSNSSSRFVKFSGNYSYADFRRSTAVTRGFSSVKVIEREDELHIKTSEGFTFLYDQLTSVVVRVTSPYKVMNSNADSVSGNTLIWNITKSNADNKSILIDYSTKKETTPSTSETPTTPDNPSATAPVEDDSSFDIVTVVLIVSLVLLVGLILVVVLASKNKNNNRI